MNGCLMIFVAGKNQQLMNLPLPCLIPKGTVVPFIYSQTFSGLVVLFPDFFGGYEDFWNKSSRNIMDLKAMVRAVPTTYHAIRGEL